MKTSFCITWKNSCDQNMLYRVVKRCRRPAMSPATMRFSPAKKWLLTITIRGKKKTGEMFPVLATFHHAPATSNLFDKPGCSLKLISGQIISNWYYCSLNWTFLCSRYTVLLKSKLPPLVLFLARRVSFLSRCVKFLTRVTEPNIFGIYYYIIVD